jgi:hypothetical protein
MILTNTPKIYLYTIMFYPPTNEQQIQEPQKKKEKKERKNK